MAPITILVLLAASAFAHPQRNDMKTAIAKLINEIDMNHLTSKPSIKFTQELSNLKVSAGESVTFLCEVSSTPTAVIYWTKDGERIQGDDELNSYEKISNAGHEIVESGIVSSTLEIPCASKDHAGQYKCVAYNGHQTESSSSILEIENEDVHCPSNRRTAPKIVLWTESRFEMEGNSATLICRPNKKSSIVWQFESKLLSTDDGRYELLPNGDLLIRNIKWADMGSYYCLARNKYGESRAETFLYPTKKRT